MSVVSWSAKHAPDPENPGYVKVVGSYAHDFLQWAKMLGKPAWSQQGDACILGRPIEIRPKHIEHLGSKDEKVTPETLFEVIDPGCSVQMYWPLSVLEPIFEKMLKHNPIFLIDPHTREFITRSSI